MIPNEPLLVNEYESMAALFALWFLFGGIFSHRVRCPALEGEQVPVLSNVKEFIKTTDGKKIYLTDRRVALLATTTIDSFGLEQYQIGIATDTTAVEHNKRVRDCQTANGQF